MSKLRRALSKAYSVSRNSWGGRIVFVGHLLFMIVVLRHYEIGFPSLPVIAFVLVDSPQLMLLRLVTGPLRITGWSWTLLGPFISIPWWAYGIAAEFAIRRLVSSKLKKLLSCRFSLSSARPVLVLRLMGAAIALTP
jgi:hypothetical protein